MSINKTVKNLLIEKFGSELSQKIIEKMVSNLDGKELEGYFRKVSFSNWVTVG